MEANINLSFFQILKLIQSLLSDEKSKSYHALEKRP